MQLLVSSDGRILWASPASPAALFGLEPSALMGQKLQGFIDLFAEYCSGEAVALVTCTAPGNVDAGLGYCHTHAACPLLKALLQTQHNCCSTPCTALHRNKIVFTAPAVHTCANVIVLHT
jgi:hypothetical protein